MIKPNGLVVMTTPFSWLEEYTDRSKWLWGFHSPIDRSPVHGEIHCCDGSKGVERVHKEPFPLTIREHARKYQYIVADASAWKKK